VRNLLTAVTATAVEICAMESVGRSCINIGVGREKADKMAGVGCE
jgi:hypothetical protein